MEQDWKKIYQQRPNNSYQVWNDNIRNRYEDRHNNPTQTRTFSINNTTQTISFPVQITEHMDYALPIEPNIRYMRNFKISEREVKNQLKAIKDGKAPGPDGIKGELYKNLADDR